MKRIEIHYNFTRIFLKILINFSIKNNNKEIIMIPSSPSITIEEQKQVIKVINIFLEM